MKIKINWKKAWEITRDFAAPCALTVASDAGTANFGVKYYKSE